jgi:predicted aspartyl protease
MNIFIFLLALVSIADAFVYPKSIATFRVGFHDQQFSSSLSSSLDQQDEQSLMDEVISMKASEIKRELDLFGINTSDVFEKNELINRLVEHRRKAKGKKNTKGTSDNHQTSDNLYPEESGSLADDVIRVPMEFHSLIPAQSVPSSNSNVYLRPSPGKYPSIQLVIPGQSRKMTLLVDTACSGIVLRPSILQLYNLPKLNTGISMTAAGGTTTAGSVAKLVSPRMVDGTILEDMIVAGQDIGALPSVLDGIIGISFLNQFESVTFDFEQSELILSKTRINHLKMEDWSQMEVIAKSFMEMCRIGVWTMDVTMDGRGPVKMLLDTGAAATFLNWKGVKDLNMDRNHPRIQRNTSALGAMGADNVALALSHRFTLKNRVNFTSDPANVGPFEPLGIDLQKYGSLNIDIGDLPVLSVLQVDNVGGIIGNDILMRCDVLHLDLGQKHRPEIIMLNRRKDVSLPADDTSALLDVV